MMIGMIKWMMIMKMMMKTVCITQGCHYSNNIRKTEQKRKMEISKMLFKNKRHINNNEKENVSMVKAWFCSLSQLPCKIMAVLLHFFFLSAFAWMLVEGLHLYSMVIKVFGSEGSKHFYYYGIGWGRSAQQALITTLRWKIIHLTYLHTSEQTHLSYSLCDFFLLLCLFKNTLCPLTLLSPNSPDVLSPPHTRPLP